MLKIMGRSQTDEPLEIDMVLLKETPNTFVFEEIKNNISRNGKLIGKLYLQKWGIDEQPGKVEITIKVYPAALPN